MGTITYILRAGMEGLLTPFDWLGPFWGLTIVSLLSGVGMLWVVGKTTPQKLVERSRNKMDSAVYEIRLFLDSPKRVAISLGRLMGNSLLYVAYMMPAFVILALPMIFMYLSLETRHGMEAIPVNHPFVISIELADGVDGRQLSVTPSEDVVITAPPVYVASEQRVHLRAEAKKQSSSSLHFDVGGRAVEKLIVSDPGATQMAPERESGANLLISYGPESNLDGPITSISVPHGAKDTSYLGIGMPWWLWWLILMMVAAFGLKKPMNVAL
jgi:hypothetical protein